MPLAQIESVLSCLPDDDDDENDEEVKEEKRQQQDQPRELEAADL